MLIRYMFWLTAFTSSAAPVNSNSSLLFSVQLNPVMWSPVHQMLLEDWPLSEDESDVEWPAATKCFMCGRNMPWYVIRERAACFCPSNSCYDKIVRNGCSPCGVVGAALRCILQGTVLFHEDDICARVGAFLVEHERPEAFYNAAWSYSLQQQGKLDQLMPDGTIIQRGTVEQKREHRLAFAQMPEPSH